MISNEKKFYKLEFCIVFLYTFRDLCILSGGLELENILTVEDINNYQLAWDFEEREEGVRYPVFNYNIKRNCAKSSAFETFFSENRPRVPSFELAHSKVHNDKCEGLYRVLGISFRYDLFIIKMI